MLLVKWYPAVDWICEYYHLAGTMMVQMIMNGILGVAGYPRDTMT